MPARNPGQALEGLQQTIEQVRGVLSCRVVLDQDGRISEVHILARRTRSAKQIVRDVESICQAQFGVAVDHKCISVAQIDDQENAVSPTSRLTPQGIHVSSSGSNLEVKVELVGADGVAYEGVAGGAQSNVNRLRLVAMAALFAVEEYLRGLCNFILDDVVAFSIGRFEGVLVGITLVTDQGEEGLVGSALVRRDTSEAVVKAVLNAVNRRVALINTQAS